MTAVADAAQVIKNADINGVDHVYSFFVPENYQMPASNTDLLITDVGEFYSEHGSDVHTETAQTIAVNIYKGSKASGSLDTLENSIISAFENGHWLAVYVSPIMIDPTTHQKTKAMQFRKYRKREF